MHAVAAGIETVANQLKALLPDDDRGALEALMAELRGRRCRVAMLGQVKAGKSSLVNALVRRPGYCPTNINPWTAVVCHLHFGGPSERLAKAIFTFFDDEDWRHLASGGRLRELSERLGVPVDQDLLDEQLALTRNRAERRLGRQFELLLGQKHCFAQPSAELLARYVSVGDDDSGTRRGTRAGRYADVTKQAELFCELAPFDYPFTITDTPGTNDPFLVRDDLTRQAIDGADIHVVVMTAEQAFTEADLALLRMLRGLHAERMIVFVNRIDALGDGRSDVRHVVDHVRDQLVEEFPNVAVPVVTGSALWAGLASDPGAIRSAADLPPALLAHAEDAEALLAAADRTGDPASHAILEAGIRNAAGLDALEAAIDRLALAGPTMLGLLRALDSLETLLERVETRLWHDQAAIESAVALAEGQATGRDPQADLEAQLAALEPIPRQLDDILGMAEQELAMIRTVTIERIRVVLDEVIDVFAEAQGEALLMADRLSRMTRPWRCETRPLRRDLEHAFLAAYRYGARELLAAERHAAGRLDAISRALLAEDAAEDEAPCMIAVDATPSISPLGQIVVLDLGDPWERWWQRWQSTDQRVGRLRTLVRSEFQLIIEALIVSAADMLQTQMQAAWERTEKAKVELLRALDLRRRHLAEAQRSLRGEGGRGAASLIGDCRARARDNQTSLRQCAALVAALQDVRDDMATRLQAAR